MPTRSFIVICIFSAFLGGCAPSAKSPEVSAANAPQPTERENPVQPEATTPVPTAISQPTSTTTAYGPDGDRFPPGLNPLTGQPSADPDLLKIPAVLVSISHFPPSGRPQAGLSFAPFVYEFSITRGETRFLAAFYGEFPEAEVPLKGDCLVRSGAFLQTGAVLGNRVWLDSDGDGAQNLGEVGIPGVCVRLLDEGGSVLGTTTTDSNGMYGFNVEAGTRYGLRFQLPKGMRFTTSNLGVEDLDSDSDPQTGETGSFLAGADSVTWDSGMVPDEKAEATAIATVVSPAAGVGPVRSGRLLYAHLAAAYTNSCLIYAFADPTILAKLPHCAFVSHEDANGGEMIAIERLRAVAEDNMRHTADRAFNYASNLYSEPAPPGGIDAERLDVHFHRTNESAWVYDPLYRAYLRMVDDPERDALGVLHYDVDRLTGRQLYVENVVVVMVDMDVVTRTNLDIRLDGGNTGPAQLFRDGQLYDIRWSTRGGDYEKRTGVRRPIQFLNQDGTPAALRPGHTWVILVTPFSYFEPAGNAGFRVRYAPPAGEAQ